MIYLAAAAVLVTIVRYTLAVRAEGSSRVLMELPASALAGLIAGLWLGISSRLAMRLISIANDAPRFTWGGTMQILFTFALMGAALGLLYTGLFRPRLRSRGFLFGMLLLLGSWYPLARAARQQLADPPEPLMLFVMTGAALAVMWLPYALIVERLAVAMASCFGGRGVTTNPALRAG
jgi:hypothetical protein